MLRNAISGTQKFRKIFSEIKKEKKKIKKFWKSTSFS